MALINGPLLLLVYKLGLVGRVCVEPIVWGGSCPKSPNFGEYFNLYGAKYVKKMSIVLINGLLLPIR